MEEKSEKVLETFLFYGVLPHFFFFVYGYIIKILIVYELLRLLESLAKQACKRVY